MNEILSCYIQKNNKNNDFNTDDWNVNVTLVTWGQPTH